jgi:hypothetical protein
MQSLLHLATVHYCDYPFPNLIIPVPGEFMGGGGPRVPIVGDVYTSTETPPENGVLHCFFPILFGFIV